jgi:hypothetical protein
LTNGRDIARIVETARDHYRAINSDIANAKDRVEHIRLTALAQSAHNLLLSLIEFETGLVYSHTTERAYEQMNERTVETQEPLDIPDFKSPYDPRNLVD